MDKVESESTKIHQQLVENSFFVSVIAPCGKNVILAWFEYNNNHQQDLLCSRPQPVHLCNNHIQDVFHIVQRGINKYLLTSEILFFLISSLLVFARFLKQFTHKASVSIFSILMHKSALITAEYKLLCYQIHKISIYNSYALP